MKLFLFKQNSGLQIQTSHRSLETWSYALDMISNLFSFLFTSTTFGTPLVQFRWIVRLRDTYLLTLIINIYMYRLQVTCFTHGKLCHRISTCSTSFPAASTRHTLPVFEKSIVSQCKRCQHTILSRWTLSLLCTVEWHKRYKLSTAHVLHKNKRFRFLRIPEYTHAREHERTRTHI